MKNRSPDQDDFRARSLDVVQKNYLYGGPLVAMKMIARDLKKISREILREYDLSRAKENIEYLDLLFLAMKELNRYPIPPESRSKVEKFRSAVIDFILPVFHKYSFQHESGYGRAFSRLYNTISAYNPQEDTPESRIYSAYEDGLSSAAIGGLLQASDRVSDHVVRMGDRLRTVLKKSNKRDS